MSLTHLVLVTHSVYCSDVAQSVGEAAEAIWSNKYSDKANQCTIQQDVLYMYIPFLQCIQDQKTSQCEKTGS